MKLIQTKIPDVIIIEPTLFHDERGWFMELFNEERFHTDLKKLNLPIPRPFVQDNLSCSKKGVLRGLHYQRSPYEQGKLIHVIKGAIHDAIVDIRQSSPTFGCSFSIELNAKNKLMLWIPEGFAHGFMSLQNDTQVVYKTTQFYNKDSECSINWNDPILNIKWPKISKLIINEKDKLAPLLVISE